MKSRPAGCQAENFSSHQKVDQFRAKFRIAGLPSTRRRAPVSVHDRSKPKPVSSVQPCRRLRSGGCRSPGSDVYRLSHRSQNPYFDYAPFGFRVLPDALYASAPVLWGSTIEISKPFCNLVGQSGAISLQSGSCRRFSPMNLLQASILSIIATHSAAAVARAAACWTTTLWPRIDSKPLRICEFLRRPTR